TEGMLYPVLHKLEREEEIVAEWKTPQGGRRRKYYRLKEKGNAALEKHRADWMAVTSALEKLWKGSSPCFS
ncbi:MAG: helix-turn-helix transcriptional regulator, partial [Pseudanabaenales cyanobacterium]|nr:helix-turn-helix transcriptional regulator [Pseudanabaenales cyanobacterium]